MKISKQGINEKFSIANKLGIFSASLFITASAVYFFAPIIGSHADTTQEADINLNIAPGIGIRTSAANVNLNTTVGSFVHNSVNVDVATNSQYGYTLTLEDKDSSSSMTATGISDVVTSDFSGKKTNSEMADNTWGFSLDTTDYYKVPANGNPVALKRTNTVMATDYETTTVDFGAKVGMNLTAGTYSDVVVFTAYVNGQDGKPSDGPDPDDPDDDLGNEPDGIMQDFTCSMLLNIGDTMLLEDERDGNTYNVRKLEDSKCWMTENLRLTNKTLTSDDSNIPAGTTWTVPASDLTSFSTAFNTNSVYYDITYGGYYTYYAATAGWGTNSVSSGNSPRDICPKGWRLPTGGYSGEFNTLYSFYNTPELIQGDPGFKLSGYIEFGYYELTEEYGNYWSSTTVKNSKNLANYLSLNQWSVNAQSSGAKYNGHAIRCIAI